MDLDKLRRIRSTAADELDRKKQLEEQERHRRLALYEARNADEAAEKANREAQNIISQIEQKAEQAAKNGKRSCVIMQGKTRSTQNPIYQGWLNKTISPDVLDIAGRMVYEYCKQKGLNPMIDFKQGNTNSFAVKYWTEGEFSISIRW